MVLKTHLEPLKVPPVGQLKNLFFYKSERVRSVTWKHVTVETFTKDKITHGVSEVVVDVIYLANYCFEEHFNECMYM